MRSRLFPELIRFRAPTGLLAEIASTAEREGLTASTYLRRLAMLDIARKNEAERDKANFTMHGGPGGPLIAA